MLLLASPGCHCPRNRGESRHRHLWIEIQPLSRIHCRKDYPRIMGTSVSNIYFNIMAQERSTPPRNNETTSTEGHSTAQRHHKLQACCEKNSQCSITTLARSGPSLHKRRRCNCRPVVRGRSTHPRSVIVGARIAGCARRLVRTSLVLLCMIIGAWLQDNSQFRRGCGNQTSALWTLHQNSALGRNMQVTLFIRQPSLCRWIVPLRTKVLSSRAFVLPYCRHEALCSPPCSLRIGPRHYPSSCPADER